MQTLISSHFRRSITSLSRPPPPLSRIIPLKSHLPPPPLLPSRSPFVPSISQPRFISSFKEGKKKSSGRNSAGRITIFHRGGGSKRLLRKIDFKRQTSAAGVVERIEYDPNRSSRIALVRWTEGAMFRRQSKKLSLSQPPQRELSEPTTASVSSKFTFCSLPAKNVDQRVSANVTGSLTGLPRIAVAGAKPAFFVPMSKESIEKDSVSLSQIQKWRPHGHLWAQRLRRKAALSWHCLEQPKGDGKISESKPKAEQGSVSPSQVLAYAFSSNRPVQASGLGILLAKPTAEMPKAGRAPVSYILASHQMEEGQRVVNYDGSKPFKSGSSRPSQNGAEGDEQLASNYEALDLNFQAGHCMPLADIRIGTLVHDIELHPGQGAKLVRGAGTFAKVLKEPAAQCLVRLPSGREKLIDSRCRATIGIASNLNHRARKLRKAGQSRWLGRRPVVRGVAMNPVDHPHGGGEGRTSGGRPSVSPWGKPTKSGYKTSSRKKKERV